MKAVADTAATYAAAGYLTIVDGIILPAWFLRPLAEALGEAGHRVAYAVLRAPLDVCLSRVSDREGLPLADTDVVERLWNDFADLGELESHAVEVNERTPDEVCDILESGLRAGNWRFPAA